MQIDCPLSKADLGWAAAKRYACIHKLLEESVSDKTGASGLQPAKQAMCEHMVDGAGYKDEDASAVRNRFFK